MASNSPGGDKGQENGQQGSPSAAASPGPRQPRAGARAELVQDKVGFFEQVFGGGGRRRDQRSSSRGKESVVSSGGGASVSGGSRVEVGYHGPRTDARDRSSEDPRRHRIPRASRSRSAGRSPGRDTGPDTAMGRDDLPSSPYRSIPIKRTQSGRMLDHSVTAASSHSSKPRALSFRVSPTKSQEDGVHQPLQPIFSRVTPPGTRDQTLSISQHIQAKVSSTRPDPVYQKPPPLPERPPRQHQRHSEPPRSPTREVSKKYHKNPSKFLLS